MDRYAQDTTMKKDVLKTIYAHKKITRAEIGEKTGLSMTSVTKFTRSLIEDTIVHECGTLESTGGRKTTLLAINPEYAYIIGVDLGGYADKIAIVRMDGSLVREWYIPDENSATQLITAGIGYKGLCDRIEQIFNQYGRKRFLAVCVGVSGMVDHQNGHIVFCPNLSGWDGFDLSDQLAKRFDIPVFVDTSARCMALAEYHYGCGQNVAHQIFVSLGYSSIAAALIVDHKLYRGSQSFAGEIGHVMSSDEGVTCTCGNVDCLELSATLKMIISRVYGKVKDFSGLSPLRQHLPSDFTLADISAALIEQAIESGDKQCYEVIHDAGVKIGTALANMLNMLNPELVIIGGGVMEHFPDILKIVRDTVRKRSLITVQQNLEIKKATLGWRGSVIGSTVMAHLKMLG